MPAPTHPMTTSSLAGLPAQISQSTLLTLVGLLGGATPDHLTMLLSHKPTSQLSIAESLRVQAKVAELARKDLIRVEVVETTTKQLRSSECWTYRLTTRGRELAAGLEGEQRRVVVAISRLAGLDLPASPSGEDNPWVTEDDLLTHAWPATADRYHVRRRLKRMADAGLIERTTSCPRRQVQLVTLTEDGAREIRAWHRVRSGSLPFLALRPRLGQSVHHLMVVSAAITLAERYRAVIVGIKSDETLRSETRRGRRFAKGVADQALPDGRVLLEIPGGGQVYHQDIEILTSKYTDAKIAAKYADLPPDTYYVATTMRLCDRVAKLVGRRPDLLR